MNPLTLMPCCIAGGWGRSSTPASGEFGAAHVAGSIHIGLGGQYATWAGTVLDRTHPS
jgi:hypothetical protein